jgi:hypothetical protein
VEDAREGEPSHAESGFYKRFAPRKKKWVGMHRVEK